MVRQKLFKNLVNWRGMTHTEALPYEEQKKKTQSKNTKYWVRYTSSQTTKYRRRYYQADKCVINGKSQSLALYNTKQCTFYSQPGLPQNIEGNIKKKKIIK